MARVAQEVSSEPPDGPPLLTGGDDASNYINKLRQMSNSNGLQWTLSGYAFWMPPGWTHSCRNCSGKADCHNPAAFL